MISLEKRTIDIYVAKKERQIFVQGYFGRTYLLRNCYMQPIHTKMKLHQLIQGSGSFKLDISKSFV